jgi:hypothetical protein
METGGQMAGMGRRGEERGGRGGGDILWLWAHCSKVWTSDEVWEKTVHDESEQVLMSFWLTGDIECPRPNSIASMVCGQRPFAA